MIDSHTGVGMEAIEGLRFLASLPLAGTGRTKGGEKTQPFNRFHSRLFTILLQNKERIILSQLEKMFFRHEIKD